MFLKTTLSQIASYIRGRREYDAMLRMFATVSSVFSGVFANVSDVCFKCFIYFRSYVAIVASICFRTRLSVASSSCFFFFAVSPQCQTREGGGVTGRPHMLAGGHTRRDVGGQTRDARPREAAARASGRAAARASGRAASVLTFGR
jgi:hypothetical protein